jgi:hypothetical protein
MNKKQLIVAWVIGIIICILIISTPKEYLMRSSSGGYYKVSIPNPYTITKIQWDFVLRYSLVTLIIGGLLIYTLRDKKK